MTGGPGRGGRSSRSSRAASAESGISVGSVVRDHTAERRKRTDAKPRSQKSAPVKETPVKEAPVKETPQKTPAPTRGESQRELSAIRERPDSASEEAEGGKIDAAPGDGDGGDSSPRDSGNHSLAGEDPADLRESDHREPEHRELEHKEAEHREPEREQEQGESEHREQEHEESEHREPEHAKAEHKDPEHRTSSKQERRASSKQEHRASSKEDQRTSSKQEHRTSSKQDYRASSKQEHRASPKEDHRTSSREHRTSSKQDYKAPEEPNPAAEDFEGQPHQAEPAADPEEAALTQFSESRDEPEAGPEPMSGDMEVLRAAEKMPLGDGPTDGVARSVSLERVIIEKYHGEPQPEEDADAYQERAEIPPLLKGGDDKEDKHDRVADDHAAKPGQKPAHAEALDENRNKEHARRGERNHTKMKENGADKGSRASSKAAQSGAARTESRKQTANSRPSRKPTKIPRSKPVARSHEDLRAELHEENNGKMATLNLPKEDSTLQKSASLVNIPRNPSALMADLHVYLVPREKWSAPRRLAERTSRQDTISLGFVRVHPESNLNLLRRDISAQLLGNELALRHYKFVRPVGKHFTQVKAKQESQLKARNFMPPYTSDPEIHLLRLLPHDPLDELEDSAYWRRWDRAFRLDHDYPLVRNTSDIDREEPAWTEMHVKKQYRHWSPRRPGVSEPDWGRRTDAGPVHSDWDRAVRRRAGSMPGLPGTPPVVLPSHYYSDQGDYNSHDYDDYDSHDGRRSDRGDDGRYDHDYGRHVYFSDQGDMDRYDHYHHQDHYSHHSGHARHSHRGYHGDYDRYEHDYGRHGDYRRHETRRLARGRRHRSPHARPPPPAASSDEESPAETRHSRRPRRSAARRHTASEGRRSPDSDSSGVLFIDNGRLVITVPSTPAVAPPAVDRQSMGPERTESPPPPPRVLLEYARMERPKRPGTDHPRRRRSSVPARLRPGVSRIPVPARRRTARPGRAQESRRRPTSGETVTDVLVIEHPAEVENTAGNPGPPPLQIQETTALVAEAGAGAGAGAAVEGQSPAAAATPPRLGVDDRSPVDYIPRRRKSQHVQQDRVGFLLAGLNGGESDDDPYSTEYREMYKKKEADKSEKLKQADAMIVGGDELEKDTSYLTEYVKKDGHRPDRVVQSDAELLDRDLFEKDTSYQTQFVTHSEDEYRTKGNARPSSSLVQTGEFDDGGRGSRRQSEGTDAGKGAAKDGVGADGGGRGGADEARKDGDMAGADGGANGASEGGAWGGADGVFKDGDKDASQSSVREDATLASKKEGWVDKGYNTDADGTSKSEKNALEREDRDRISKKASTGSESAHRSLVKEAGKEKSDNLSGDESKKWASRDASRNRRDKKASENKNDEEEESKTRNDREGRAKRRDKSKRRTKNEKDKSKNRAKEEQNVARAREERHEDNRSEDHDKHNRHGKRADKKDEKKEHSDDEILNLRKKLAAVKRRRAESEQKRDELVVLSRSLQEQLSIKKDEDMQKWRELYLQERKLTGPLEEACSSLRREIDKLHKKLLQRVETRHKGTGKEGPSRKLTMKINCKRLASDIEDWERRVRSMQMIQDTEVKLRKQAERDVKELRQELSQKRVTVTQTRSQYGLDAVDWYLLLGRQKAGRTSRSPSRQAAQNQRDSAPQPA